jgi:hypothetical protein
MEHQAVKLAMDDGKENVVEGGEGHCRVENCAGEHCTVLRAIWAMRM